MREVQIRRRETKSHLPPPVIANSKKVLSSIYDGAGPLRGVDGDEEVKLLCKHLGLKENDPNLSKELRAWWADLRVEIDSDGKVLNITTDDKGDPASVYDYLIYKWALRHRFVGKDREDMLNSPNKMYYIYDPDVELKYQNNKVKIIRAAYEQFIKISENEDKLDLVIKVLTDSDPNDMSMEQKQNYTNQLIENDPESFVAVVTDKNIEIKALISDLVSLNVINKISNQYWWIEEKLGDDLGEAVLYFKDKKNSETVTRLKAKLQEIKR
jgi:hypothetical protein